MSAVALIGSPSQLLSLFEARHAGAISDAPVVVLQGDAQRYESLLALGGAEIADAVPLARRGLPAALARLKSSDVLVIGDPYSALGHLAIVARRHGAVVVLEDGAASLRAVRSIAAGRPLVRAHERRAWPRWLAAPAGRRLAGANRRGLMRSAPTLVHSLAHDDDVIGALRRRGVTVVRHRFGWTADRACAGATQELSGATQVQGRRLVLGSSLAADGHVDAGWYAAWLRTVLDVPDAVFKPHRREVHRAVVDVLDESGATVLRDTMPVEVIVAAVAPAEVVTLPTTAALTLPMVRPELALACHPVPAASWRSGVPIAMVELVGEVGERARFAGL